MTASKHRIEFRGETYTLSQLVKLYGIKYNTLYARFFKHKMSPEEALGSLKKRHQV
jgi:hypothetical protein